ncbi:MAG TPA: FtsQ-type POTRA domain-containing protein [Gaiellaceae bacterium]|nr:FtsQ-type POTRA domain-containing protein [Gaiellaceae bacterium]
MATQRRASQRPRVAAATLPARRARAPRLGRLAPSRRSIAAGVALVALAGAAYAAARETSAFAVRSIEVAGAPPPVAAQVRQALASLDGTSLLALDGTALRRRVESLPAIVAADYDRAFPHTLRVAVVPERPAAVVRAGTHAWLVSARARVLQALPRDRTGTLPRIWLPASAELRPGEFLTAAQAGPAAEALALADGFPARIAAASFAGRSLVFHLGSGLELRLGDPADLRLKLAVARRALRVLPAGTTYLDVSLPGRPVAGSVASSETTNSQVSTGD